MSNSYKIRSRFFIDQSELEKYNGKAFAILGMDVRPIEDNGASEPFFDIRFPDGSIHDFVNAECLFWGYDEDLDKLAIEAGHKPPSQTA